jgi:hypothetical protein
MGKEGRVNECFDAWQDRITSAQKTRYWSHEKKAHWIDEEPSPKQAQNHQVNRLTRRCGPENRRSLRGQSRRAAHRAAKQGRAGQKQLGLSAS